MEDKEYNVVTLENGIEYTEIHRLDDNGNTYVFLANLDQPEDFCIRRLEVKDDKTYIVGLSNENEFRHIIKIFNREIMN